MNIKRFQIIIRSYFLKWTRICINKERWRKNKRDKNFIILKQMEEAQKKYGLMNEVAMKGCTYALCYVYEKRRSESALVQISYCCRGGGVNQPQSKFYTVVV